MAYFALRPQLFFDAVADVEPSNQSMPGSTVTFNIQNDLAVAATPLAESTDVSAVAMSATQVSVTLAEYGQALITTALGRGTSFLDIDHLATNVIGYNAGLSLDTIAGNVLQAGTQVAYANGGSSRATLTSANTLTAADIRKARATLRTNNVADEGGYYLCFIHPHQVYDLQSQTGAATWNEPHAYSAPTQIWQGVVGSFNGFTFIETPRTPEFAGAGSGGINVYGALCLGRQALAKAYSYVDGNGPYPSVVPGPVTDHLRRFVPWGWYWLGNYAVFRQASLYRIESASALN